MTQAEQGELGSRSWRVRIRIERKGDRQRVGTGGQCQGHLMALPRTWSLGAQETAPHCVLLPHAECCGPRRAQVSLTFSGPPLPVFLLQSVGGLPLNASYLRAVPMVERSCPARNPPNQRWTPALATHARPPGYSGLHAARHWFFCTLCLKDVVCVTGQPWSPPVSSLTSSRSASPQKPQPCPFYSLGCVFWNHLAFPGVPHFAWLPGTCAHLPTSLLPACFMDSNGKLSEEEGGLFPFSPSEAAWLRSPGFPYPHP